MIPVPEIELREENGSVRAYRVDNNKKVSIPSFPKPHVDRGEWVAGLSPAVLEASRMYYTDKWTWDDDSERYRLLVDLIEAHIRSGGILAGYKGDSQADAASFYCPYIPLED